LGHDARRPQLVHRPRRVREVGARADVDTHGHALDLVAEEVDERPPELGRQVVHCEEPDVLEGVERGGLAGPAHAGEHDERRAHAPAPGSQRHASTTSPRSTTATPPTCARTVPGQITVPAPSSSSTANAAPPRWRSVITPVPAAGLRPGASSPCWTICQRSPSCTTVTGTPATDTPNATGPPSSTISQSEPVRNPTLPSAQPRSAAPGGSSPGWGAAVTWSRCA